MNPYDILGVPPEADDGTIRSAYLDAIKRFPPERYPERFTAISEAYQALRDEKSRLHYELFDMQPGRRLSHGGRVAAFCLERKTHAS